MHVPPEQERVQQKAMADLYERYWFLVLRTIHQHISSHEDAEDVLLDVFLAALESNVFFQLVEQQQVAWLRRTAYNKSMDYHRHRARQPLLPLQEDDETLFADDERSPEKTFLKREEQIRLQSQIALLPELQQEILRLRFTDGLRCKEIATRVQKNEGTVRSLLSRTLNGLRGLYAKPTEGKEYA
ncbi:MAG TPA: sigma-70 family RNA polymerase sigma factor [Ktedonobacteraceae bacterium]